VDGDITCYDDGISAIIFRPDIPHSELVIQLCTAENGPCSLALHKNWRATHNSSFILIDGLGNFPRPNEILKRLLDELHSNRATVQNHRLDLLERNIGIVQGFENREGDPVDEIGRDIFEIPPRNFSPEINILMHRFNLPHQLVEIAVGEYRGSGISIGREHMFHPRSFLE
jgi:hypothetical protein